LLDAALRRDDPSGRRPLRLLTMAEAADFLNVPYNWLRVKVTRLEVPHTRIGKHVRFTEQHLVEIIANGEIPAPDPGGQQTATFMRGRRRRRRSP
jgi:excisionase family DNA binding protein